MQVILYFLVFVMLIKRYTKMTFSFSGDVHRSYK